LIPALILFSIFAVAVALTGIIYLYALRKEMFDVPNKRSSHSVPTPRGGGAAIAILIICVVAYGLFDGVVDRNTGIALAVSGLVVALVGWLDDCSDVAAHWRLLVQLIAAGWVVAFAWPIPGVPLPGGELIFGLAAAPVWVLWITWATNLYNFMDGIDGIAGVEAATVSAGAAIILFGVHQTGLAFLAASAAAASLGFLVWNWPPARVFMGDSGSAFLGLFFGSLALLSHALDAMPMWSWLILLGVFVVDASWTLVRRLVRGERVFEAHRCHAYQHAARKFGAHRPVTLGVGLMNLLWLAPLAALATWRPSWGVLLLIVGWAPLVVIAVYFRAGLPESHIGQQLAS
jgi:Fuc2NAc and GlcNAc transferase